MYIKIKMQSPSERFLSNCFNDKHFEEIEIEEIIEEEEMPPLRLPPPMLSVLYTCPDKHVDSDEEDAFSTNGIIESKYTTPKRERSVSMLQENKPPENVFETILQQLSGSSSDNTDVYDDYLDEMNNMHQPNSNRICIEVESKIEVECNSSSNKRKVESEDESEVEEEEDEQEYEVERTMEIEVEKEIIIIKPKKKYKPQKRKPCSISEMTNMACDYFQKGPSIFTRKGLKDYIRPLLPKSENRDKILDRRLYDILNITESIGYIRKEAKRPQTQKQYTQNRKIKKEILLEPSKQEKQRSDHRAYSSYSLCVDKEFEIGLQRTQKAEIQKRIEEKKAWLLSKCKNNVVDSEPIKKDTYFLTIDKEEYVDSRFLNDDTKKELLLNASEKLVVHTANDMFLRFLEQNVL